MRNLICIMLAIIFLLPLLGYGTVQNICKVIKVHPNWYQAAKDTQEKWGVPVSVQMAIIGQESDFQANAKNPASSAYGYAQVVNKIWYTYKKKIGNYAEQRDVFSNASNFIGWYANLMKKEVHISPTNAFSLYLAYHDGGTGYLTDVRDRYNYVKQLAFHVQYVASVYQKQLVSC